MDWVKLLHATRTPQAAAALDLTAYKYHTLPRKLFEYLINKLFEERSPLPREERA